MLRTLLLLRVCSAATNSVYCCYCWEYVLLLLRVGETLGRRCCWPHLSVLVLAANYRACLLLKIKPTWAVHVDEPYFCPDGGCWSRRRRYICEIGSYIMVGKYHFLEFSCPFTWYSRHSNAENIHTLYAIHVVWFLAGLAWNKTIGRSWSYFSSVTAPRQHCQLQRKFWT